MYSAFPTSRARHLQHLSASIGHQRAARKPRRRKTKCARTCIGSYFKLFRPITVLKVSAKTHSKMLLQAAEPFDFAQDMCMTGFRNRGLRSELVAHARLIVEGSLEWQTALFRDQADFRLLRGRTASVFHTASSTWQDSRFGCNRPRRGPGGAGGLLSARGSRMRLRFGHAVGSADPVTLVWGLRQGCVLGPRLLRWSLEDVIWPIFEAFGSDVCGAVSPAACSEGRRHVVHIAIAEVVTHKAPNNLKWRLGLG